MSNNAQVIISKKKTTIPVTQAEIGRYDQLIASGVFDTATLCSALGVTPRRLQSIRFTSAMLKAPKLTSMAPPKSLVRLTKHGHLVVDKQVVVNMANASGLNLQSAKGHVTVQQGVPNTLIVTLV